MALLDRGEPVTVVTRDPRRAERFTNRGATAAVADVHDVDELRDVLRRGRSAFLLMPPADPSTNTVEEERRTVASIVQAVEGAALEKVVVQSTYGAQPGEGIGDLGILYEFEQAVRSSVGRTSVVRGAYYMSNWDQALESARDEGIVHTFFPAGFTLPMVAPADLGQVAARLLSEDEADGDGDDGDGDDSDVRYVEGPARYTAADVARAFGQALDREVRTVEIPRSAWVDTLRSFGFSSAAADSYARMSGLTLDGAERPEAPERGPTSLDTYIAALVRERQPRA